MAVGAASAVWPPGQKPGKFFARRDPFTECPAYPAPAGCKDHNTALRKLGGGVAKAGFALLYWSSSPNANNNDNAWNVNFNNGNENNDNKNNDNYVRLVRGG